MRPRHYSKRPFAAASSAKLSNCQSSALDIMAFSCAGKGIGGEKGGLKPRHDNERPLAAASSAKLSNCQSSALDGMALSCAGKGGEQQERVMGKEGEQIDADVDCQQSAIPVQRKAVKTPTIRL